MTKVLFRENLFTKKTIFVRLNLHIKELLMLFKKSFLINALLVVLCGTASCLQFYDDGVKVTQELNKHQFTPDQYIIGLYCYGRASCTRQELLDCRQSLFEVGIFVRHFSDLRDSFAFVCDQLGIPRTF